MIEVGVRLRNKFIAGETAPGAVEAFNGELIPHYLGHIAMALITVRTANAVLDISVEPPVFRLRDAPAVVFEGTIFNPEREFKPYDADSGFQVLATGDYEGPGSELSYYASNP